MMRSITVAVTAAALTLTLQAQTTTHSGTAARRRATATTAPQEGVAAVGSMPAATGPVKTLFALRYIELKPGTGEPAETHKWYTVHYTGWTTDGKKFDSSFDHDGKEPIVFPVGARRVIIGWDTGFQGMRVGGKRRIIVPYQLAYGEQGRPPVIPEKADLVFDVELLAQSDAPPQQQAAPVAPRPATPPSGQPAAPATAAPQGTPQPGTNPVTAPASAPAQPAQPAAKPE